MNEYRKIVIMPVAMPASLLVILPLKSAYDKFVPTWGITILGLCFVLGIPTILASGIRKMGEAVKGKCQLKYFH